MGTFRVISKEIKEQILKRIKDDGVSAAQAARDAGISSKTIYNWLSRGITQGSEILENRRLKKEIEGLYCLVGKLTSMLESSKKKNNGW